MRTFFLSLLVVSCLLGVAVASDAGPDAAVSSVSAPDGGAATRSGEVAAPVETPSQPDAFGMIESLVGAVRSGNIRLAASVLLSLAMLALGLVRDKIGWFSGDRGGAVLVMLLSFGGALSTALASSADLDWKLFAGAVAVAWTAVGGYTWFKRIVWPKDKVSVA